MEKATVRVTNNRPTLLVIPTAAGSPAVRLVPGGNNLPAETIKALEALPSTKGTGKVWASWKTLGWVKVASPAESKAEARKPEGPPAPASLSDRKAEAAEAMVAVETSPDTLRKWYATDRRKPIREAIKARLKAIGAEGSEPPDSETGPE